MPISACADPTNNISASVEKSTSEETLATGFRVAPVATVKRGGGGVAVLASLGNPTMDPTAPPSSTEQLSVTS